MPISETYNEDCLSAMRKLPSSSVSYVITSPPYNMGNSTGGGLKQYKPNYRIDGGMKARSGGGKWNSAALCEGYESFDDNMPHADYVAWQKDVLTECWRLIDDAGAIFYNHKQRVFSGVCVTPLDYLPAGVTLRQIITWARTGGINFNQRFFMPTDEWIVILAKPGFKLKNRGVSGYGSVWNFSADFNNPHPAPFPYELPKRILDSVTTIDKPIFDPFCGSGTVRLAAYDFGYDFIGCEVSAKYCQLAEERFQRHIAQPKLFDSIKTPEKQELLFA